MRDSTLNYVYSQSFLLFTVVLQTLFGLIKDAAITSSYRTPSNLKVCRPPTPTPVICLPED